ncbi:MAG: polysaccharide deacetylase family protein [Clostridium sp.]
MYFAIFMTMIVIIFLIHSVAPTIYNKHINSRIVKRTNKFNEIMLTFDDGPDERYTNKLLDILKENDVKATFFVVAENAKNNPSIIHRMHDEGHTIALHSLSHKNALFYSYIYTKKDFEKSIEIMKNFNYQINYYRPPWGHSNMFTNFFVKKFNLKMILWDVMAEDWSKHATVDSISSKLLLRTDGNSIICLHDAGENSGGDLDAPLKTIDALRSVLSELKLEGFKFVTPERLGL